MIRPLSKNIPPAATATAGGMLLQGERKPGLGRGSISEKLPSSSCVEGLQQAFAGEMGQNLGSAAKNSCVFGEVWVWGECRRV